MKPRVVLPLGLILALSAAAPPASAERKVLVVEGRALDQDGYPVSGVRVEARGNSRNASTESNRAGEFSLTLPLPGAAELGGTTVKLSIRATRSGWRFALPGGEGELRLEVATERGADGVQRCVARSNDVRVAAAAARASGLDGDAVAVAALNFLGSRGGPVSMPAPTTMHVAKLALSGGLPSVETSVAPPDTARAAAPPVARAQPAGDPGRVGGTEPAPDARRSMLETPASKSAEDARTRARRDREERERALARIRGESRAYGTPAKPETVAILTAPTTPPPAPAPVKITRAPAASPSPAPAATRAPVAAATTPPSPSSRREPAASPTTSRASGTTGPRIHPQPSSTGRGRSMPLVISRPPWPFPPEAGSDSCLCRVEGTVEVQSPNPLPERVPITVGLLTSPAHVDTLELFMGSPRRFLLSQVPCGTQRLTLDVRSSLEFDVLTRDALDGFRCEAGRVHQFRIVLRPR